MSTRADVDTFLDFIGKTFVERGTIAKCNSKASICQGSCGFTSITAVRDHLDEDDFLSLKSQRPKSQHDALLQGKQPILEFKEKTCGFSHVRVNSAIHLSQMNDFWRGSSCRSTTPRLGMEPYSGRGLKLGGQRFSADAEVPGRRKIRRRSVFSRKKSEADEQRKSITLSSISSDWLFKISKILKE